MFFTNGVPKLVAEIKDNDYPKRISNLFYSILKIHFVVAIIIFAGMMIYVENISKYLNFHNPNLMFSFSLAVSVGVMTSFLVQFMQGLARFKAYSFITIATSLLKLGVIISAMYIGLGLFL